MNLERRVKDLEQEVAILKGQIQETLLEIHDKLLTNQYADLRSADSRPAQLPMIQPPAAQTQKFDQGARKHENAPNSKVVTLKDFVENATLPDADDDDDLDSDFASQEDWDQIEKSEEWALRVAKRVGFQGTRELIQNMMADGQITEANGRALLKYLKLYARRVADQRRAKHEGHEPEQDGHRTQKKSTAQDDGDEEDENVSRNLILRLIAGVGNAGMRSKKRA